MTVVDVVVVAFPDAVLFRSVCVPEADDDESTTPLLFLALSSDVETTENCLASRTQGTGEGKQP